MHWPSIKIKRKKLRYPCNRLWWPKGLSNAEAPTFYRKSAHKQRWLRLKIIDNKVFIFFILGFCILLRVLYQGYWKNRPSQQLFRVSFIFIIILLYKKKCFLYYYIYKNKWPPLWSSGESSWLHIRRPGFDFRHYQEKKQWVWTGSNQPREYNWGATW
jgi:hypothetical protein